MASRNDRIRNALSLSPIVVALFLNLHRRSGVLFAVALHLSDALRQFLLEKADHVRAHLRAEDVLLQIGQELLFKTVNADHQLVLARPAVAVTGTPVPLCCPLAVTRNNHQLRAALAADKETAEQILLMGCHAARAVVSKQNPLLLEPIVHRIPQLNGNDLPLRYCDPLPLGFRSWPADLPSRFGIAFLLSTVPNMHATVAFIAQHLENGRRAPCACTPVPRRHRRKHALSIESFRDSRVTGTVSKHLEDPPNNGCLLLIDFEANTDDGRTPVLCCSARILNRDVAVPEAPAARDETTQYAPFLSAMHLVGKSHQELLVHHAVKGEELPRRLMLGVNALADGNDMHVIELKNLYEAKSVLNIARQTRRVIHEKSVKWPGPLLRSFDQCL